MKRLIIAFLQFSANFFNLGQSKQCSIVGGDPSCINKRLENIYEEKKTEVDVFLQHHRYHRHDHESELKNDIFTVEDLIHYHDNKKAFICPPGEDYNCCRDIRSLVNAPFDEKFSLLDNSGVFRPNGIKIGHLIADGWWNNCKRDGYNYCKLRHGLPFVFTKVDHCVPASCNVDSLNKYLDLNDNVSENSTARYEICYDRGLWRQNYSWYEITGFAMVGLWTLFILFSPIKSLNIKTILRGHIFSRFCISPK